MSLQEQQKRPWRPPDAEQDELENQTSSLILAFLKDGKIDGKDFTVAQDKQDRVEQDIAHLLQQAHALGIQYGQAMINHQQEAVLIGNAGTNIKGFLKKAKDLIASMIGRIRDAVEKIIDNDGEPEEAEDVVDKMLGYMPDSAAATLIHSEVEEAIFDIFADKGVEFVSWVCEPDACDACRGNEVVGPVKYGDLFPTGHAYPTVHIGCRCNLVPVIEW